MGFIVLVYCFSTIIYFAVSMFKIPLLLTIDANLGRVDIRMLSDQTLMEMLIEGFCDEAKGQNQDSDGMFLEVCKWPSVRCDNDGNVTELESMGEANGTIDFAFIPPKCELLYADRSNLSGTIETSSLPEALIYFVADENNLYGTVDLIELPSELEAFNVPKNKFTGSAVLNSLPECMISLDLNHNSFSGTLCLTSLPATLSYLGISDNAFTGEFHLVNAQEGINVYASRNAFESSAIIQEEISCVEIGSSGVIYVCDENGDEHREIGHVIHL